MKRIVLSCLTVLFAVLFANTVNAQTNFPAPAPPSGLPSTAKVDSAHIFICETQATPVDLTWDVLKTRLDNNQGKWIPSSHPNLEAMGKYDGRNVFKVIGSGVGTYVFDFVTNDGVSFCGVGKDQYFRAYVHILPDFKANGNDVTRVVCEGEVLTGAAWPTDPKKWIINQPNVAYLESLGATLTASPVSWTMPSPASGTKTLSAVISIAPGTLIKDIDGANVYPCDNNQFTVNLTITTDTLIVENPKEMTLCVFDLTSGLYNSNVYALLGRTNLEGRTGSSVAISPASGFIAEPTLNFADMYDKFIASPTTNNRYEVTFTYKECDPVGTVKTVKDIIHLTNQKINYYDVEKEICKTGPGSDSLNLTDQYNTGTPSTIPNGFLGSNYINWVYNGQSKSGTPGGTIPIPYDGGVLNKMINKSKLRPGTDYYFTFTKTPGSGSICDEGATASLLIRALDGGGTLDGRLQVCYVNSVQTYNLSEVMALSTNAAWTAVHSGNPTITAAGVVNIAAQTTRGQYIFNYQDGAANCGTKDGKFYLTVTDRILVPKVLEEKFCVASLPNEVNLYNILGTTTGTWTANTVNGNAIAPGTYFDATTGILKVRELNNAFANKPAALEGNSFDFTFTPDGCGGLNSSVTHKVTIHFTDIL